MIATITGRIQTKVTMYSVLLLMSVLLQPVLGMHIWTLAAIAASVGLVLEILWGLFIPYQPGWLSFAMAGIEFATIAYIAVSLQVPIGLGAAALYYLLVWGFTQLLLLYVVPVVAPQWPERSLRLW